MPGLPAVFELVQGRATGEREVRLEQRDLVGAQVVGPRGSVQLDESDWRVDVVEKERSVACREPVDQAGAVGHEAADEYRVGGTHRESRIAADGWPVCVQAQVAEIGVG